MVERQAVLFFQAALFRRGLTGQLPDKVDKHKRFFAGVFQRVRLTWAGNGYIACGNGGFFAIAVHKRAFALHD